MMNVIISMDRQLTLLYTSVLLNNSLLKFNFSALSNVAYSQRNLNREHWFLNYVRKPPRKLEISYIYFQEFAGSVDAEDGAEGYELPSIRPAKFAHVKEILDKLQEEVDLDKQIDRKKYAMTVYARAVFLIEKTFEKALTKQIYPLLKPELFRIWWTPAAALAFLRAYDDKEQWRYLRSTR